MLFSLSTVELNRLTRKRLQASAFRAIARTAGAAGHVAGSVGFEIRRPTFIVGSGRAGSTLLHKVLRTHHGIALYIDEANQLWHPNSNPFHMRKIETPPIVADPRRFTEISVENWPPGHVERIKRVLTGWNFMVGPKKPFVLKSAMISFLIPKVLEMFPDAQFLHIYRHGAPVNESLVKKEFETHTHLEGLHTEQEFREASARYWRECVLEIRRCAETIFKERGVPLFEMSYEDFCEDPETQMAEVAKFIGCDPKGFGYDYSRISSKNYKAGAYENDEKWTSLLEIMRPALEDLGYACAPSANG